MPKLDFYPEEWSRLLELCDFTDEEKKIIELTRRGWCIADIAAELYASQRTIIRRRKSISNKIVHCILVNKL